MEIKGKAWKRWTGFVILGIAGLAVLGMGYQGIAGYLDERAAPPPGRMVDVGGFRMHLYCTGSGSPTVVLDSGLSDAWIHWYKVQPAVAQTTRVCAYDRAGLGWSETSSRPRTSKVIAGELHALLKKAGIAGPYILAGHSMGGLDVRMFASMYPGEVAGMVLVDASHPKQFERLPAELRSGGNEWERAIRREALLMPLGIPRLFGWCGTSLPERADAFRAFDCTVKQKRSTIAELEAFAENLSEAGATGSLGNMPLAVLSQAPRNPDPRTKAVLEVMKPLQQELAELSSRGVLIAADGSGHQVHRERADLVINALLEVVAQARQRTN
jgi:pimeloyl-ACP methyl ester carboxylesterase